MLDILNVLSVIAVVVVENSSHREEWESIGDTSSTLASHKAHMYSNFYTSKKE